MVKIAQIGAMLKPIGNFGGVSLCPSLPGGKYEFLDGWHRETLLELRWARAPTGQCHENTGREEWILIDQAFDSIPFGGISRRHRIPRLQARMLSHSRTLLEALPRAHCEQS